MDEVLKTRFFETYFLNFAEEKIPAKFLHNVFLLKHPDWKYYWISPFGDYIWSDARYVQYGMGNHKWVGNRWLKISVDHESRRYCTLTENAQESRMKIAILVTRVVYGPRPPRLEICHENDDKTTDHYAKLRYDTRQANAQDAVENFSMQQGEDRYCAKLTEEIVRSCRLRYNGGKGESGYVLAREFNVTPPAMYNALNRRTWKCVA